MIDYATYEFYTGTYKGLLSSDLFNSLIPKASREIDNVVNRDIKEADLTEYPKIKWVACQLVDFLNKYDNGSKSSGKISSISIDGVNKSFVSSTSEDISNEKQGIYNGLPHELTRFL